VNRYKWLIAVAVGLLSASAILYGIHYLIFHDAHHLFIFLVGDIAFVPIEVLLVVIIIERLLDRQEKKSMFQKLNMVIGTFFTELGTSLIGEMTKYVKNQDELTKMIGVSGEWTDSDFKKALEQAERLEYQLDPEKINHEKLRQMLVAKRDILLLLLGNPNLLEHEKFTDTLWAVFHLMEELRSRESYENLPQTDLEHLAGDAERAYSLLTVEWLAYCWHLQKAYLYIFSIVARTHPLQENPNPVVTK
jgi:hypothetical protein